MLFKRNNWLKTYFFIQLRIDFYDGNFLFFRRNYGIYYLTDFPFLQLSYNQ